MMNALIRHVGFPIRGAARFSLKFLPPDGPWAACMMVEWTWRGRGHWHCFFFPCWPSLATCADCGKEIGKDAGPKEGWQLEDGRTVCHACCAADTRRVIGLTVTESDRVSKQATTEEKR